MFDQPVDLANSDVLTADATRGTFWSAGYRPSHCHRARSVSSSLYTDNADLDDLWIAITWAG